MRAAIFGSCVTRDAFRVTGRCAEVATYVARQTIRSAVTPSDYAVEALLSGINSEGFDERAMISASRKQSFSTIAASQADYVIVDLIDERFSTRTNGVSVMTLSTAFPTEACRGWEHWRPLEERSVQETLGAIPKFAIEIREAAVGRPIIIHRGFWAQGHDQTDEMNAILTQYYDLLSDELGCESTVVPASLRVSDPDHKWGPAPYHYVLGYYDHVVQQIDRMMAERIAP